MMAEKIYLTFIWIKAKILSLILKICKITDRSIIYENRFGVKEINPKRSPNNQSAQSVSLNLAADELYLGIDFLNDNYTLMDTPISESPHYKLMYALSENKSIRHTEYIERMLKGCLDERYTIIAYYLDKSYFRSCYNRTVEKINTNDYEVIVYKFKDRYYIHDGKHRAALCALQGKAVRCRVVGIETVVRDFNAYKIDRLMGKRKYLKHNNVLEFATTLMKKHGEG